MSGSSSLGDAVPIHWDRVRRDEFERIVESLINRLHASNGRVVAVNGRGGDDGIDVLAEVAARRHVYQTKFFPGGFSSDNRQRRKQIRRSFDTALAVARPDAWILVVPSTLTSGERRFVEEMGRGGGIKVEILDRVGLDDIASANPDIVDYYTRDQLLEAAKVYGQEKAIITGGMPEIAERVSGLGRAVSALDPDWTFDLLWQGDEPIHILRAKHPRAAEVSPISISLAVDLRGAPDALAKALKRSIGFGSPDEVALPPEFVTQFKISGPSWITSSHEAVSVQWGSMGQIATNGQRLQLASIDESGNRVASFEGDVSYLGSGPEGVTVTAKFYGAAVLTFLLPHAGGGGGSVNYETDVNGLEPAQMLLALDLDETVFSCRTLELRVDGRGLGELHFGAGRGFKSEERADNFDQLRDLAMDLEIVQRWCRQHFPVPREMTTLDRILIRFARLLIEGKCTVMPGVRTLTVTLNGSDSAELRQLLVTGGGLKLEQDSFSITVAGRELTLGTVALYHMQTHALNGQDAIDALDSDSAEEFEVQLAAGNGEHFRFYMPGVVPGDNVPLVPLSWGLRGVKEPLELTTSQGGG